MEDHRQKPARRTGADDICHPQPARKYQKQPKPAGQGGRRRKRRHPLLFGRWRKGGLIFAMPDSNASFVPRWRNSGLRFAVPPALVQARELGSICPLMQRFKPTMLPAPVSFTIPIRPCGSSFQFFAALGLLARHPRLNSLWLHFYNRLHRDVSTASSHTLRLRST